MCVWGAVHPDMVQQFRARIITSSRVLLEWKPPSRPGVVKYKVSNPFATMEKLELLYAAAAASD